MRRPPLSDVSFLAYTFRPSKNPKPTGLRHRILQGSKGQRKARINAYNKMPAEKQAIIDRTGNRESFLRGDITFTNAKRQLRETAVRLGLLKPVRVRPRPIGRMQQIYDQAVVEHLKDEGLDQAELWNEANVRARLTRTNRVTKRNILFSTKAEIRRESKRPARDFEDEYDFNPWWYH